MSTLNRIIIAGFACLCTSVLVLPSFADGGRPECRPIPTTCPSTQPALDVGFDCTVTIPDLTGLDMFTLSGCYMTYLDEIVQTPPPGTYVVHGQDYLQISLAARECFVPQATRNGGEQCYDLWAYCYVMFPLNYPITCPETPRTLTADENCKAIVPDLTGEVTVPDCCGQEGRSDCCGPLLITQTPAAGTEIGLGTTEVSILVERCIWYYCCEFSPGAREDGDDCACTEPLGSCVVELNVVDNTPPVIENCPDDLTFGADLDCLGVIPDLTVPNVEGLVIATDNCTPTEDLIITQDPPAGSEIGLGTTEVTVTVTDGAGLGASCTVQVFLEENGCLTPPAPQPVGCDPANQSLNLLMSFIMHAPVCGATCPIVAVLTVCGIVALKRRRRRRQR